MYCFLISAKFSVMFDKNNQFSIFVITSFAYLKAMKKWSKIENQFHVIIVIHIKIIAVRKI